MHQTKRVAVSSAQTFLQPSAPIKSVRHPAIAARPHQPQHAPADPDTTHSIDPNSGPTAAPADDTRHRLRSRPVPAAPARTGSGIRPEPGGGGGHNRAAGPLCVPQRTSAQKTRRPASLPPGNILTQLPPGNTPPWARKGATAPIVPAVPAEPTAPAGPFIPRRLFPQATPTAQSRRPAVRKHPRARGCLPLKAASHPGSHFSPARTPQTQHDAC